MPLHSSPFRSGPLRSHYSQIVGFIPVPKMPNSYPEIYFPVLVQIAIALLVAAA